MAPSCSDIETEENRGDLPASEDQVEAGCNPTDAKVGVERWPKTIVLFLSPPIFLLVLLIPFADMSSLAHTLPAVPGPVITFRVTGPISFRSRSSWELHCS